MLIIISEDTINPQNTIQYVKYPPINIGFHGSQAVFNKFKAGRTAFFARTPQFAEGYVESKAMDMGSDADMYIYKCDLRGINFFDASNDAHLKKLEAILPDVVTIYMLWGSGEVPKEEILDEMRGVMTIYPIDEKLWEGKKVGDIFRYDGEQKLILDLTEDHITIMPLRTFEYIEKNSSSLDARRRFGGQNYGKFKETVYAKYVAYQKKLADKYEDRNHYFYMANDNEKKTLERLLDEARRELFKVLKHDKEFYPKKMPLAPYKENMKTNYHIFESLENYIKKLGFDGHIAMEYYYGTQDFTYGVYNPERVKILEKRKH